MSLYQDTNNSFNCIPRYFISEGYISLVLTKEQSQIGISLKNFLDIKKDSIVIIERIKDKIIIKSYYYPHLNLLQIQNILNKNLDNFNDYPIGSIYSEKVYKFKLLLEEL